MMPKAILSYVGTDSTPKLLGEVEVRAIVNWVPNMFRIGTWQYCFYCGEPASCQDHIIPWVFLSVARDHSGESGGIKTPSCASCNSILSDAFYPSLWTRCEGLQERLRLHCKKILRSPKWKRGEIKALGKNLRDAITRKQKERAIAIKRLSWQSSEKFMQLVDEAHAKAVWEYPENKDLHNFLLPPWKNDPQNLHPPSENSAEGSQRISA